MQRFLRASSSLSSIKRHWLTTTQFTSNAHFYDEIENAYPYKARPIAHAFSEINQLRDDTIDAKNLAREALPEFEHDEQETKVKAEALIDESSQTIQGFNHLLKTIKAHPEFLGQHESAQKIKAAQDSAKAAQSSADAADSIATAQWIQAFNSFNRK